MRNFLLAAFLLLPTLAYADDETSRAKWTNMGYFDDQQIIGLSYDANLHGPQSKAAVKTPQGTMIMRELADMPDAHRSQVLILEYDCKHKLVKTVGVIDFSGPMATGDRSYPEIHPVWETVDSEADAQVPFKLACR